MARVGYLPVPSTLLYAAGGFSQLNIHATASAFLPGSSFSSRDTAFSGFTVGPGIETVVTGGWTTRLEYRFSQFEQKEVATGRHHAAVEPHDSRRPVLQVRHGLWRQHRAGAGLGFSAQGFLARGS